MSTHVLNGSIDNVFESLGNGSITKLNFCIRPFKNAITLSLGLNTAPTSTEPPEIVDGPAYNSNVVNVCPACTSIDSPGSSVSNVILTSTVSPDVKGTLAKLAFKFWTELFALPFKL